MGKIQLLKSVNTFMIQWVNNYIDCLIQQGLIDMK